MAVNLLFNMVMLVPMIYTGDTQDLHFKILIRIFSAAKIWERHGILERSIGVLPKEIVSYNNATTLLTASLVTFFILSVLELIIYLAYNKYVSINIMSTIDCVQINVFQVHPWKEILQDSDIDADLGKKKSYSIYI